MPTVNFAVKAMIVRNGHELLVIKKSDAEDVNPNTYDVPGGRLEYGETPIEGLKREVREEVGLEIEIVRPSRTWSFVKKEKDFQLVGVTFLCRYVAGEARLSDEHSACAWINMDKLEEYGLPG